MNAVGHVVSRIWLSFRLSNLPDEYFVLQWSIINLDLFCLNCGHGLSNLNVVLIVYFQPKSRIIKTLPTDVSTYRHGL